MEHSENISKNITGKNMIKKESEDKTGNIENNPPCPPLNQRGEVPIYRDGGFKVRHGVPPSSAGNSGFKKHNNMKFMKTEKWRKMNKN
jgi:hypothetical protein